MWALTKQREREEGGEKRGGGKKMLKSPFVAKQNNKKIVAKKRGGRTQKKSINELNTISPYDNASGKKSKCANICIGQVIWCLPYAGFLTTIHS